MNKNQSKVAQAVNWEYLPEVATLSQYLGRRNLKEFSMSCKRYRNQLESRILDKLYLNREFLSWKFKSRLVSIKYKDTMDFLLELLGEDLKGKYQFVKEIWIFYQYEEEYAKKIIILFPHVKKLKISFDYVDEESKDILKLLKGLKHIEHIQFENDEDLWLSFDTVNEQILSKSLKSLLIYVHYAYPGFYSLFDTIDSSYINLTKITIATNKMLTNLSFSMPNLINVIFYDHQDIYFKSALVLKFIKNNPQLKLLECTSFVITHDILDAILSSKCLSCFYIPYSIHEELETFRNYRLNYSIKKLTIGTSNYNLISQLIKSCKNLEIIELGFEIGEEHKKIWDNYDRRINTLQIHMWELENCTSYIQTIEKLNFFDQAIITSDENHGNIVEVLNLDKLENYRLHPYIDKVEGNYGIHIGDKYIIKRIKY